MKQLSQDSMPIPRSLQCYLFLNFIMVIALAASVITARKIVSIGPITFPCCNIIFSFLTFPITDIISEIWGKRYAKITVYVSFMSQALFVLFIQTSIHLPHPEFWNDQATYESILGSGPRVLLASMIAFLIAQLWDVFVYAKLKHYTRGKYLWLRNNLSTMSSQFINSTIFITIAFLGTHDVLSLIVGSVFLKVLIALLDTPLVYLGVNFIHRFTGGDTLAYTADE